jgi:hypothetical protein
MLEHSIISIQNNPSLFKTTDISKIVDKRKKQNIGYFVPVKYDSLIIDLIEKINKEKKITKLQMLQKFQEQEEIEFLELGIDDGV